MKVTKHKGTMAKNSLLSTKKNAHEAAKQENDGKWGLLKQHAQWTKWVAKHKETMANKCCQANKIMTLEGGKHKKQWQMMMLSHKNNANELLCL